MKLASVTIKNYRALDDITIDLNENMNVIYGINGVGKSSILYAMHDFLTLLTSKKGIPQNYQLFSKWRIRDNNKTSQINLKFIDKSEICATLDPKEKNTKNIPNKKNEMLYDWRKKNGLFDGTKISIKNIENIHFSSFLPNVNVGLKIEAVQVGDKMDFRITQQPKVAYIRGVDYHDFKEKFEKLENIENQKRTKDANYRDPVLEKIRNSIQQIAQNFTNLTIDREQMENPLCVEKNGRYLNIEDQLSSGESAVVVLIAQIALHLAEESENCTVLIDEVDTSLHPQWQMKICKTLKTAFPEVQFIMTSHSPFIWAALNKNEIIWLDYDENNNVIKKDVEYAKGGSVESIITRFFDTDRYDEEVSHYMRTIDELIRKKDKDAASQAINSLKETYGKLPVISQLEFKMRMMGL